jgi:hypothetical protein
MTPEIPDEIKRAVSKAVRVLIRHGVVTHVQGTQQFIILKTLKDLPQDEQDQIEREIGEEE